MMAMLLKWLAGAAGPWIIGLFLTAFAGLGGWLGWVSWENQALRTEAAQARADRAQAEKQLADCKADITGLEAAVEKQNERILSLRALADAENSRKRAQKERHDAERYGGSRLARDLLPVYDNMKRAVEATPEDQKEVAAALIEGVELTMRELVSVLKKHGIDPITPQVGDKFDPQHHEAMFEAPVPGTKAGEIIQVSADGFIMHDRLLRPAQVGVSSKAR